MNKWHAITVAAAAAVVLVAPITSEAATHTYLVGKETVQEIDVFSAGVERTITFSEAVNMNTVDSNSIHLKNVTENKTLTIETKPSGDNAIKISLVNDTYKEGHQYELLIDDTITNTSGQKLKTGKICI